MSVDFPRPDSPASVPSKFGEEVLGGDDIPTTITVNEKPFLTLFLCTWLGRLAKPT